MAGTPRAVGRLVEALTHLPGVGPKTASRLAYYLLRAGREETMLLATALADLHEHTLLCSRCCNISEADPCELCADPEREQEVICVVEEPLDVLAIENTGRFKGLYHVLHGHISPMERVVPDELRFKELVKRLEGNTVREVILATNPTLEGDATAIYLARLLTPWGMTVTRLALGLPRGGDLEYADRVTLAEALVGRRRL